MKPEPDPSAHDVRNPAFPHAHTFGATVEEAPTNAREIVELELEVASDGGERPPASDAASAVVGTITVSMP